MRDRVLKWFAAGLAACALVAAACVVLRAGRGGDNSSPTTAAGETTSGIADVGGSDAGSPARDAGHGASTTLASSASAEHELMTRLRAVVDADPRAALTIADEGDRRFPDGPLTDERAFLRMRALVHLNRIVDARVRARELYARSPASPWSARAFQLTGQHPTPHPGP